MFYTRDVEDIIVARLAVVSQIAAPQIRAFSCGSMMPYWSVGGFVFSRHPVGHFYSAPPYTN